MTATHIPEFIWKVRFIAPHPRINRALPALPQRGKNQINPLKRQSGPRGRQPPIFTKCRRRNMANDTANIGQSCSLPDKISSVGVAQQV